MNRAWASFALAVSLACAEPAPPSQQPAMLASRAKGEGFLAIDADFVYWIDRGTDLPDPSKRLAKVWRVPKKGGIAKLLVGDLGWPRGLAVDAKRLYWAGFAEGKIYALDKEGGSLTALAEHENTPLDVAIDDTDVYFLATPGEVRRVPKGGGPSTRVTGGLVRPRRLAVDAANVYWVDSGGTSAGGAVMRCRKDGSGVTTLAGGLHEPGEIVLDTENVYWSDRSEGFIYRLEKDGGAPRKLAQEQWNALQLALDDDYLWWQRGERILKVRKGGGKPISWVNASHSVTGLAVDANAIYYLEMNGGVRAFPKK